MLLDLFNKKYYDLGYNLFLIIRNKEHINKYKRKFTNNKNQKVVIKYLISKMKKFEKICND